MSTPAFKLADVCVSSLKWDKRRYVGEVDLQDDTTLHTTEFCTNSTDASKAAWAWVHAQLKTLEPQP